MSRCENTKAFPSPATSRVSSTSTAESSGQTTIISNTLSHSNTKTTKQLRHWPNNFQLISLNSVTFTVIVFGLQVYLIYQCFKNLRDLMTTSESSTTSKSTADQNLNQSIVINASLITFALLFTVFHLIVSLFRLGIYSHDNFKLGKHFSNNHIDLDEEKCHFSSLASNSSVNSSNSTLPSNSAISKQKLTRAVHLNNLSSSVECLFFWFKKPAFWSHLPPLSCCFHLVAAIFILLSQLQLNSKRIQLSQKPIGDIFATKLDFLIGEPIIRLDKLNLVNTQSSIALAKRSDPSVQASNSSTAADVLLNEIIHSKDDFSIFDNQYMPTFSFTATSNAISLDFLNYLLSLILFTVKAAQTFWFTSRKFTLVLFFNFLIISLQMSVSYCSFEILYKANNLKLITSQLILFGKSTVQSAPALAATASSSQNSQLNESNNCTHDLALGVLYMISSFLLFVSGFLNSKLGYRKFEKIRIRFEKNIGKYMLNNGVIINLNTPLENKTKHEDVNEIHLIDGGTSSRTAMQIDMKNKENETAREAKFFFNYRENFMSSFLFLIYCIARFFFIYEIFILYKFTHDSFMLFAIIMELITILVWILLLILLAVKSEWPFKIDASYKLTYWNWLYYSLNNNNNNINRSNNNNRSNKSNSVNSLKQDQYISGRVSGTSSEIMKCYSQNLNNNLDISQTKTPSFKKENEFLIKSISNNNNNNNLTINTCTNNMGLLVRDDSVLLNRSSNLSSSSITEVSSLLPSACGGAGGTALSMTNHSFNSGSVKKLNGINILNPASLASSVSSSSILNSNNKVITRQFKINAPKNSVPLHCINSGDDQLNNSNNRYTFSCDDKAIRKNNYNFTNCKLNNEIVLIEEEEFNQNDCSNEYYKRMDRSQAFESDDSDLNQNSNNMIKEYNAYVKNQYEINNISIKNDENAIQMHSMYKPSMAPYSRNISFRASKSNTTVGELMESSLSVRDKPSTVPNTYSTNILNRGMNKLINNETTSSSVSTTDSGRDSLVDSPVNKLQQQQQPNSNTNINSSSQNILPATKAYLLANTTSTSCASVSVDNNVSINLKMSTSSNFSDDCC